MTKQEVDLKEGEGIRTAIDVAIFNDNGKVLLGKRLAQAGFGTWGFVGGHLRTGEKIIDGARREISEELGKNAQIEPINEILAVRENSLEPNLIHHVTVIIRGKYIGGDIKVNEPKRCEKWEWFSLDNLPSELFSGVQETLESFKQQKATVVSDWR